MFIYNGKLAINLSDCLMVIDIFYNYIVIFYTILCLSRTLYHKACMLVFRGVSPGCRLFSTASIVVITHTAVALDRMAWKSLLSQQIKLVKFFQEGPEFCGGGCTMFPDRDIAKKSGSGIGPNKSVSRRPRCGYFFFVLVSSLKH